MCSEHDWHSGNPPERFAIDFSFFLSQKLAGGRRGSGSRPWFLESWQSGSGKNRKDYEHEESQDVDELPIELRRVEDANVSLNKQSDSLSIKSKSLGDILEIQRLDLVRSRSSIPGLCSMLTSELNLDGESRTSSSMSGSKPRLVKQKSHLVDDIGLENPENTAIEELAKGVPDFQVREGETNEEDMCIEAALISLVCIPGNTGSVLEARKYPETEFHERGTDVHGEDGGKGKIASEHHETGFPERGHLLQRKHLRSVQGFLLLRQRDSKVPTTEKWPYEQDRSGSRRRTSRSRVYRSRTVS